LEYIIAGSEATIRAEEIPEEILQKLGGDEQAPFLFNDTHQLSKNYYCCFKSLVSIDVCVDN